MGHVLGIFFYHAVFLLKTFWLIKASCMSNIVLIDVECYILKFMSLLDYKNCCWCSSSAETVLLLLSHT